MKRFPALSTATELGPDSWALMAGPPSPEKPCEPLPATVVMIPSEDTLRIRAVSAMKIIPAPSTATPKADKSAATGVVIPLEENLRRRASYEVTPRGYAE